MKLAEALSLRADAARRAEQLRARVAASARYQEGETPAEDAAALLTEAAEVLTELESLIRRINRTNAGTPVESGGTLTDALARRDVLRLRHAMVTTAAGAAAGDGQRRYRQLRSELRMIPALPVAELRAQADDLARRVREVDVLIQRSTGRSTCWTEDRRVEQVADVEACTNPRAGGQSGSLRRAGGQAQGFESPGIQRSPAKRTGYGAQGTAHHQVQIHNGEGGQGATPLDHLWSFGSLSRSVESGSRSNSVQWRHDDDR